MGGVKRLIRQLRMRCYKNNIANQYILHYLVAAGSFGPQQFHVLRILYPQTNIPSRYRRPIRYTAAGSEIV